jgi:iron complex transport system ATP-binding protein
MLCLKNVNSGFPHGKTQKVLHAGISFELQPGSLLLLAGKNGSGKSTLMRILAGLNEPPSGEILIQNKNLHRQSIAERASLLSMMQATPPDVPLTPASEVVFGGRQRFVSPWKKTESEQFEIAEKAMIRMDLHHLKDGFFNSLSDGEKQKMMLARCLAQETPVLLLDEPLAFLDYPSRREMLALLRDLCDAENKIIVYSSHDLELALKHCDAMLLLQDGGKFRYTNNKSEIGNLQPETLFE